MTDTSNVKEELLSLVFEDRDLTKKLTTSIIMARKNNRNARIVVTVRPEYTFSMIRLLPSNRTWAVSSPEGVEKKNHVRYFGRPDNSLRFR